MSGITDQYKNTKAVTETLMLQSNRLVLVKPDGTQAQASCMRSRRGDTYSLRKSGINLLAVDAICNNSEGDIVVIGHLQAFCLAKQIIVPVATIKFIGEKAMDRKRLQTMQVASALTMK